MYLDWYKKVYRQYSNPQDGDLLLFLMVQYYINRY